MRAAARTALAFAAAPLVVPVTVTIVLVPFIGNSPSVIAVIAAVAALFAYGGTVTLGVPAYFLLRARLRASPGTASLLGGAIAALTTVITGVSVIGLNLSALNVVSGLAVIVAFLGIFVGFAAWHIAAPDRP
jgi:hypothetical protein